MRRTRAALMTIGLALAASASAQAHWLSDGWHGFWRDTKNNAAWPSPHVYADRQSVQQPFAQMTANGWRKQNLISSHHFDDNGSTLTRNGLLRVRQIVRDVPAQHRTLFVQEAATDDVTQARIDAVQLAAASVAGNESLPPVVATSLDDQGTPADQVEAKYTKFYQSQPTPKLPTSGGGGSSSGGAGS